MMKAIQITEFGGPEKMALVDLDIPTPGADEVLLDVLSIGINYADTHQVENSYLVPQNLPLVPGIEVVGRTPDGTRVVALVSSGGYAQKVTANKLGMIKVPEGVSDEDALCMLIQGSTAWHILKTMGHLKPGETRAQLAQRCAAGLNKHTGKLLVPFPQFAALLKDATGQ